MKLNGVILKKIDRIDEVLSELYSLGKLTGDDLRKDWRVWRAVERNLQILCEILIDVCQRLLTIAGDPPAESGSQAIERCVQRGILSEASQYVSAVRFRNFIVHRYDVIDPEVVASVVNDHLATFETFKQEVLDYVAERNAS